MRIATNHSREALQIIHLGIIVTIDSHEDGAVDGRGDVILQTVLLTVEGEENQTTGGSLGLGGYDSTTLSNEFTGLVGQDSLILIRVRRNTVFQLVDLTGHLNLSTVSNHEVGSIQSNIVEHVGCSGLLKGLCNTVDAIIASTGVLTEPVAILIVTVRLSASDISHGITLVTIAATIAEVLT